jgi:hypothetical protein
MNWLLLKGSFKSLCSMSNDTPCIFGLSSVDRLGGTRLPLCSTPRKNSDLRCSILSLLFQSRRTDGLLYRAPVRKLIADTARGI